MEIHPITMAADLAKGKSVNLNDKRAFTNYLEECPDMLHAINQESESLEYLLSTLDNLEQDENYVYNSWLSIIFCRTIQVLVRKGFDSLEYQLLISNPIVDRIVKHEVTCPTLSQNEYLPTSPLLSLLDYQAFTQKSVWEEIVNSPTLVFECDNFLNAYLTWLSQKSDESQTELAALQKYSSLIFFASVVLATHAPKNNTLHALVTSEQMDFGFWGLWLQRKVFLIMYDALGLTLFLPYQKVVRGGLIYYLVVSDKLSRTEKEILKEEVRQRLLEIGYEGKYTHYVSSFPDPLIMEYLIQ